MTDTNQINLCKFLPHANEQHLLVKKIKPGEKYGNKKQHFTKKEKKKTRQGKRNTKVILSMFIKHRLRQKSDEKNLVNVITMGKRVAKAD